MSITVALNHRTEYRYDRRVRLSPQVIRLRPAPHARTPVPGYTLRVEPQPHFLNWQQDPQGNWQARVVFPEPVDHFEVEVELIARLDVFNPFDFFLDETAENVPFDYADELASELAPFLKLRDCGQAFHDLVAENHLDGQQTVDYLVDVNSRLQQLIGYTIRMEPGVQSPDETLAKGTGSCRDSAWLLVQLLRHVGIAARFVSGYLVQLVADQTAVDGPDGPDADFTDLHAWCEAYVPGAGWIGLDPTSGLLAGEGHIPLAATPEPSSAAPISGAVDECEVEFGHHMKVSRIAETPRVTRPYDDAQWAAIDALGHAVDQDIAAQDMRLTMGGEPTFVSARDFQSAEWNTAAVGPTKQGLAAGLAERLRDCYAPGGLITYGQGKWYPGESLPRWAYSVIWRKDGVAVSNAPPPADRKTPPEHAEARQLMHKVADRLGLTEDYILDAYEDPLEYITEEARLPEGVSVTDADIDDPERRARLARVFSKPLSAPRAVVLPVQHWQTRGRNHWLSERWKLRRGRLYLTPGDSRAGLRLPLDSLPGGFAGPGVEAVVPDDPSLRPAPLPARFTAEHEPSPWQEQQLTGTGSGAAPGGVRTALAIEPVDGQLSVFMPPVRNAAEYLELLQMVEDSAGELGLPIRIEGYPPPHDPRLQVLKLTPDPGVIEVNIHPADNWGALRDNTVTLYEEARQNHLCAEKFLIDGKHTGTGGGNHIVVGAAHADESPFLRRPDLLASTIRYWQNHPALSYLFAGLFIGPTSQSPRIDEARDDLLYELEIALSEVPPAGADVPPWLVDRIFRNLLTDLTGNTHRAEICIDKLYSPDSATGRLGLVEFRAFEMPPHAQMSLAQQLLVRALLAWFWREPYRRPLRRFGNRLHDEMLLPHYLRLDLLEILEDLRGAGYDFDPAWFAPHYEFRFPRYGAVEVAGQTLELRGALECWPTMGEEPAASGTARYVDSSLERVQLRVDGYRPERYLITCNGRRLPLRRAAGGDTGPWVAGVRFRAWQPWSGLHPTVGAHNPLVFDVIDLWSNRSVGGCSYHVHHPGGRNFETYPVNGNEAESRRLARFFPHGHTPGPCPPPPEEHNPRHEVTLDLRRPPMETF